MTNKLLSLNKANKILKIDDSKLDRYLLYYHNELLREADENNKGAPCLTAIEQEMLNRYERVYEMFDIGRTDGMIRSFLMKTYDLKDRQARYVIEEARILYGITGASDKQGRKQASINYYRTISNIALKKEQYEVAGKLWKLADELEGLFNATTQELDPAQFLKPSTFVFTDNINVLVSQNKKRLEADE